jgi:lipopolysaccharide export system permease protein
VKIVTKYVLREHFAPLAFSLSALTSLLLLQYVAKQLGQLVGKGLHWTIIAEFLILSVPFTVAMTMPMAVLVATLHAFSRMASENEITAFKASGFSMQRLMVPVIVSGAFITLFMVWFNDQVLPRSNHRLATLSNDIARVKPTFALREQVINEVSPGKLFLRTSHLASMSNKMKDVTIWDMGDPQRRRTINADSGLLELSSDGHDLLLTLFDGSMDELTGSEPTRLQRVFFHTDFVKVRNIGNSLERQSQDLEKSDREMTVCELQRKVIKAGREQDSAWRELARVLPREAEAVAPRPGSLGLGGRYCALRAMMARSGLVRSADAAVLAAAPVVQDAAQQVPQQSRVRPRDTNPNRNVTLQAQEQSRVTDSVQAEIQASTLKMILTQSQTVIDGNQVEIEKKFAIASACVIFCLLGMPIALRFPRGGVGLTIGVSLGVFALYYVGLIVGEELARRNYLSPAWAMWTTNLLLLIVGVYLVARLGNEGSTSRGSEATEWIERLRDKFRRRKGLV